MTTKPTIGEKEGVMTERIWDRFLTERDKAHLAIFPPAPQYGFGERAAVLSIDNYRRVVGDRPEPLLESIRTWPGSTGLEGWEALSHTERLLEVARGSGRPVIHVTALSAEESGIAGWTPRLDDQVTEAPLEPAQRDRFDRRYDFVEQAAPLPGEVIVKKTAPSAFFGTPLAAHLNRERIDTLIVCGESASGCVRATVVDGCSLRFRMIVVEECVYDRHEASLAMSLFDMDQKYADVRGIAEVTSWLQGTVQE